MKCPHCNGEHPDDFKFCPAAGKEIVNELKACSNEACPDFWKHILPQEAKFCPQCGLSLELDISNDSLFPFCGVTLSKTNIQDFVNDLVLEQGYYGLYVDLNEGVTIWQRLDDSFISMIWIWNNDVSKELSHQWKNVIGRAFNISTVELQKILIELTRHGYECSSHTYYNSDPDNCFYQYTFSAITPDKLCMVIWHYEQREIEWNGKREDDMSFQRIIILPYKCPYCNSANVEQHFDGLEQPLVCKSCGCTWGACENKDLSTLNTLYDYCPVCGITLGETTVKEAEKISHRFAELEYCDSGLVIAWSKNSNGRKGAQIRKEAHDLVFTRIYIVRDDDMFAEWIKIGFSWDLSYDEWMNLFRERGFDIAYVVPHVDYWEEEKCYYLHAEIIATDPDYSIMFVLTFWGGRNKTKTSDNGTLYSISVETDIEEILET